MAPLSGDTSELTICHVNCQSLVAHLVEFRLFFSANPYHIICLSETWLSDMVDDSYISLPNYSLLRCDRVGKKGGGVGVYVHHCLHASILSHSSACDTYDHKPEYLYLEVKCSQAAKLLLGIVYRPPKTGYWSSFEDEFTNLNTNYKHSILIGDFNTDMYTANFDRQHLLDFVRSHNLYIIPFNATHHTQTSHTLLDLCVVDDEDKVSSYHQKPVPFLSSHDLISITYKLHIKHSTATSVSSRDFRNFDKSSFLRDLEAVDWTPFFDAASIDDKVRLLNHSMLSIFNCHAPIRSRRVARPSALWLNDSIRLAIRQRDRIRYKFKKSNSPEHWEAFKRARNNTKRLIRDARREYFNTYFAGLHSPSELWSKLRQLGLVRCRSEPLPLRIDLNELNAWYTCPSSNTIVSEEFDLPWRGYDDSFFYFQDITPAMLLESFHCLRSNAKGIDNLTASMIKLSLPVTFPLFLHLYNYSLSQACFPTLWKSALVRPIPKCKSPTCPADYRPISILCAMSKPLEKVVASQLMSHLEKHGQLDPYQSAYKKHYSAQTALLRITDDIRRAVDQRKVTIMVLFDFSKAFDRVVFSALIEKLTHLNLSTAALKWFASYITGHRQAVLGDGNDISSWSPLTAGVPQGSILGPLLFALYVSDLRSVIKCEYNFYADDLQIYLHCTVDQISETIDRLNTEITTICEWARINGLTLNSGKTKAIIFGSQRYIQGLVFDTLPSIKVHSIGIRFTDSVKLLGVTLMSTLKWKEHALNTCRKVNKQLYILRLNRELFTLSLRRKLVTSLIFPHFDYCCAVFTDITAETNLSLQRALNCSVRFVEGLRKSEHVTPAFRRLGWLKIDRRRLYFILIIVHKLLLAHEPGYLYDRIKLNTHVALHSTRSTNRQLYIPHSRTTTWQNSFIVSACRAWNELPYALRTNVRTFSFKDALYSHLLAS